jgi:hypothetical protein
MADELTHEELIEAWAFRAQGDSWEDIGALLGISPTKLRKLITNCAPPQGEASPRLDTVGYRKWARERAQERRAAQPKRPPSEPPAEADDAEDSEPENEIPDELRPPRTLSRDQQKEWYSRMIDDCDAECKLLAASGAHAEIRKVRALAINANKELARLNRDDGGDSIRINKEELAKRAQGVRDKLNAYLETKRPLLCAHCGHALSVSWGKGEAPQ